MIQFLSGAIFMGYLVCCGFFLRAHRQTGDTLFRYFALGFGLLALERVLLATAQLAHESQPAIYLLRLAAHVLIIVAVIRKNAGAGR